MTKKEFSTLLERIGRKNLSPTGIVLYNDYIGHLTVVGNEFLGINGDYVTIRSLVPKFYDNIITRSDVIVASARKEDCIFGGIYYKLNKTNYREVIKPITIHRKFIQKIILR